MSITTGSIVAGTRIGAYQILAPLGAGGMGEVYRARDAKLGRDVAIKILPAAFTSNPERLARFEREARVLASLNHPHVGGIYGIEDSEGTRALILELVEGDTLADRIARGALPVKEALAIAGQIADALDSAHEKGIVHRDLKPANIKITPNGVVKVLDFGLAKVDGAEAAPMLSQSPTMTVGATGGGVILGTAAYMSPEQARGQVVDKRSDIWSFGCVLHEMLAGRATFRGATVSDLIVAILEKEPDWAALPADTPAAIRRLLRRCLEKDSRRRLRDIADAAIDIDDVVRGATAEHVAASTGTSFPRSFLIGAGLLVVGAIALGIAAWLAVNRPADARMAPPQFSRLVRVTSGPAKEVGPVISPDGKWVAYVSDERGANDVWVKFLSGGAPSNLTASAPLEIGINTAIGGLDISPDGTRIAVQARLRGTTTPFATWEIPAPLPGLPHKLLEDGLLGMRWSPDGRRITYIRAGASAGDALWIADADGTNRREIIKAQGGLHIHWPVWSTDGFIYYMRTVATIGNLDQAEIYRISPAGGAAEVVVSTLRRAMHPLPLPDGRGLIYASNPTSGEMSLWWRPAAGGEPVRLTTGVGEYAEPRLSSNGQALVATAYDIHQALVRVSVAATSATQRSPVTDGYGGDLDPTISPARDQLVFSSWRLGERKLWTSSIDGSNAQPLTTGAGFDDRPAFSPNGRQVAFVSDRGGRRAIWLVDADGGAPRKLVDALLTGGVSWSNDGREIVYSAGAGDWPGLWALTVTDGSVRRIATPGVATDPAWSPARDLIAYMQPNTTGPTVVRLAFVTSKGEPQYASVPSPPEVPTGFNNGLVAWSPDGRQVAVISQNTNAPAAIWIVTLENAGLSYRKLTQLPNGPRIRGLAWTRDGSGIIFGQHDSASDIVLLDQLSDSRQP